MNEEFVVERGDTVFIGELKVEVLDIIKRWGEIFIATEFGDFNIDVITKILKQ